jgi:hypothetical protein
VSVTEIQPLRLGRAIKAACNKGLQDEYPEATCHYPECQKNKGASCFMMICHPEELAAAIEEWERPHILREADD